MTTGKRRVGQGLGLAVLLAIPGLRAADLRVGLIGLDTSHVTAFTAILNDTNHAEHVAGARVVAAYKGGSPDLEASWSRVEGYTRELRERYGIRIYDSIAALCQDVDAVLLESVDGRPHLAQARPVISAGKPLFIDKPMAASLRDVQEIFRLAREAKVPVFSASALRFGTNTVAARRGAVGPIVRAETFSPCHREKSHPDLFWYGVHGVESLFTVLGPGCTRVRRTALPDGRIEVTGEWTGGRVGVFREEAKGYGGRAVGERGEMAVGSFDGYGPLLREIVAFFRSGVPPVSPEETLELFAFMEAADESLRHSGAAVSLEEILTRARR